MEILMPQPGETVTEALIANWFKSVGDVVVAGDVLFEIETDKASMEVPATSSGILSEIRVTAGKTTAVNTVVAVISTEGVPVAPSASPVPAVRSMLGLPPQLGSTPIAQEPSGFGRNPQKSFGPATLASGVKVTPLARRLAMEGCVDLLKLVGSGPHGRIVAADVRVMSKSSPEPDAVPAIKTTITSTYDEIRTFYDEKSYQEIELDGMRRAVARRLTESKQTIPHFYLTTELDIEELLTLRANINASLGVRVTINDLIVKSFALALQQWPSANAIWAGDRILQFNRCDVGVAVSVDGGLFTPVIQNAQAKSLRTISTEIKNLVARAHKRQLKPAEYQGGSATVSNLGMFGVRQFEAIINPPHATILAVGAGARRPTERSDGSTAWRNQMTVTLSIDHRVIDGIIGAQLLASLKSIIEDPLRILV